MKKLVAMLTVLCLLVSTGIIAFAYGQAPSTQDWVSNITCDSSGNITITTTADMKAAAAYTWQIAIFNAPTTYADGDTGFGEIYKRSDSGAFEKDAEYATDATYIGGKSGGGAAGDTLTVAATGLEAGKTYYAMFCANSDGGNGWSWLNKSYEFTVPAASSVHNEAETITSLSVNGGTLNVTLLDTFTNAIPGLIGMYDNNGLMEVIDTSTDKGIKVTTANGWIASSLSCWDGVNPACDFVHKTSAETKYLIFSISVDGKIEGLGIEPQFLGSEGLRQAYLNDGTDAIYLVDANGTTVATTEYMAYRYQITNIPENFTGYVVVPTSRLRVTLDGSIYSNFGEGEYADYTNMYVMGLYALSSNNDSFIVDKMYYSNQDITMPAPPTSWVTNMEVASDGVVNININMPEGTWWGEVAIFTEEKTITCDGDIYNYKLDRGARNAVISGNWNGTIGPNNTDYDLPFTFVDGTTYYVYVIRYIGDAWEYNTAAYEFTYEAPAPAPESWITDMQVAAPGVVDIKITLPDGTWWSEVSIFTQEQTDKDTIINNKLDRGSRNAVIVGNFEGTIGPNNTDYDLPFSFVDGTTYYVYVSRCINPYGTTVDEVWDINLTAYEFTYVAPAVEPDVEDAWISDMTVNDDGSVKVTIDVPDDTSWTEIAIFTEDLGDIDFDTLYAGVLSRPNNGSFPYQGVEAIIGANGDFAFEFEDGVTYYVYTCRYAGNGWDNDHLSSAYEFTYEAPEPEQGTADVSVLLYGLTALMAGGAFVALKRKK